MTGFISYLCCPTLFCSICFT